MGSGSGGMMCFARLVLGGDTAMDSSRHGAKNPTLLGDGMMKGVVSSRCLGGRYLKLGTRLDGSSGGI